MSAVGRGGSRCPWGRAVRVVLATLGLLAATAVSSPASGRADTGYPVLLLHGGLGRPTDFSLMAVWLMATVTGPTPSTSV